MADFDHDGKFETGSKDTKDAQRRPLRQRTLYTSHSYVEGDTDEDVPPSEAWTKVPRPITKKTAVNSEEWKQNAAEGRKKGHSSQTTPAPFPAPPNAADEENTLTAVVTPHGTMSMCLRGRIRIDMTIDQAIRIINFENKIVLAMSASGSSVGLLHPNGRIWQYGSRVEVMAHDPRGNHKYAKMSFKGVGFTSENCALVYLVDSAGTRTTTETFSDMKFDFTLRLFYEGSRHGPPHVPAAMQLLKSAHYWHTPDGEDNWCVNGVRIAQTRDGMVKIARNSNKYRMRTSPGNGTASVTTPFLHCTASMGLTQHLFVRRGERRMHFDGSTFIVRNAGHSAGFDEKDQLKVY